MNYDHDRYDAWTWKHPLILHWMLNPGLAFNELVLGQRVPQLTLIDTRSDAPLAQRHYVPCPHCNALNPAMLYSKTPMGNFAGIVCPECGAEIPSVKNVLTWVITKLSWPIWAPFKHLYGPSLLARQRAKLLSEESLELQAKRTPRGVMMGMVFGALMAILFAIVQLLQGMPLITTAIAALLGGLVSGVLFGATMKLFLSKTGRNATQKSPTPD